MNKKILCLDFDGVLNSYTSGWVSATEIPDPPTFGAVEFCREALEHFNVVVVSSRCSEHGGMEAICDWLNKYDFPKEIEVTTFRPPSFVTLDDRALTFTGLFPAVETLIDFTPWWKNG